MFVYSVRASSVRFFAFLLATLLLMVGIVIFGRSDSVMAMSGDVSIRFDGMEENDDRVAFIESFGVSVDKTPIEEKSFRLTDEFDRVVAGYNEIQKTQGLDLSKYKNKKVTRYTYTVTNMKDANSQATVNLFIYRDRVVAADLTDTSEDGKVYALSLLPAGLLKSQEKR